MGHRVKKCSFKGCGEIFRRVHWNNRGKKSIVWRCVSRLESTGLTCKARTVPEEMLCSTIVEAVNKLLAQKDEFLPLGSLTLR